MDEQRTSGAADLPPPNDPMPSAETPKPIDSEAVSFDLDAEPTDDTPTVISKQFPRLQSIEEGIAAAASVRGRQLAHFELIEPIGVGGMAAVLRARDTQLDRCVALKILPPEMAADSENVQRFHQEARSAAKLDHENIARVFFCGEDQRLHFIAFEFVEGENLRTLLDRRGRLPVGEAVHYMLQVAAGLAHASHRGVVHRDIKPSNIIITPNGRAKLVDMGLARSKETNPDGGLTQSGITLGTFDYISPEQALEPRDADVRSDIYSLGCTFYHVLTGRPPVPEGTAAKKLHHQQHVAPPDPRQLAPEIPDDVAVILDRMMAKDPRDRFQTPDQLVHQLLVAARRLGGSPEVPEGVLSMEADLPGRRVNRPFLMAGLAAAAVIGLVFALDFSSPIRSKNKVRPSPQVGEARDKISPRDGPGPAPGPAKDKKPTVTPPANRGVAIYNPPTEPTVGHLAQWLDQQDGADRLIINLPADLDLSRAGGMASKDLVVKARRQVTIRGQGANRPSTLRFSYDAEAGQEARVALTVQCPEITVQDVRFVLDLRESHDTEMVGLLLRGGAKHLVERCEFIQASPSFKMEKKRMASVVADAGLARPHVTFRECCFLGFGRLIAGEGLRFSGVDPGGQDAVVRRGPVRLTAASCAFGPHVSTFRFNGGDESAPVAVRNCTILAGSRSAVFDLPATGNAAIDMDHCLVSRWGETGCAGLETDQAVFIHQGDASGKISFRGRDNCFHNLDGYWVIGEDDKKTGYKSFQLRAKDNDDSRVIVSHPWRATTDQQLRMLERLDTAQAFRVADRSASLRQRGRSILLVGATELLGKPCVPSTMPDIEDKPDPKRRRFLVVDPEGDDSSSAVYPRLDLAVLAARPGDTILIHSSAVLQVKPLALDTKESFDLTIKPYRGYRPILTLGETSQTDTSLFRVHDGRLRLEGLAFRLLPSKSQFKVQTVVALVGDGECLLNDCVATLDRGSFDTVLAFAAIASTDGGKVMKLDMPPIRSKELGPRLALKNCFLRGDGDLLWSRTSRPCELSITNTLAALAGSLFHVEVPADAPAPDDNHRVDLRLSRVTTYLGGHLINLTSGKDPNNLIPVRCLPKNCLFIPSPSGKALVHLEGPEASDKALKEKLDWQSMGTNGYGNFTSAVDQQPMGAEMAQPMNMEKWKKFTGEKESEFELKLKKAPPIDAPFTQLKPEEFELPMKGATDLALLAKLLRRGEGR
jgi:serine/threonine protein kinase